MPGPSAETSSALPYESKQILRGRERELKERAPQSMSARSPSQTRPWAYGARVRRCGAAHASRPLLPAREDGERSCRSCTSFWVRGSTHTKTSGSVGFAMFFQTVTRKQSLCRARASLSPRGTLPSFIPLPAMCGPCRPPLPVSCMTHGGRAPGRAPHVHQRLGAAADARQRHFQPFAGHKGLRKDLLGQELALVQVRVGRGRVMVEQKQLCDLRLSGQVHDVFPGTMPPRSEER